MKLPEKGNPRCVICDKECPGGLTMGRGSKGPYLGSGKGAGACNDQRCVDLLQHHLDLQILLGTITHCDDRLPQERRDAA